MIELEATRTAEPADRPQESKDFKFTIEEVPKTPIAIKVVGIGGCGGNIVDHMIDEGVGSVEFATVNTDEQALARSRAPTKVQLGQRVTQGHGTGSDPEIGREAALENTEDLTEILGDADMVFLAVGLGGGTGTGGAPVIASLAKQMGALTIALAVKPFAFEGAKRAENAERGIADLLEQVDTTIVIPNERLLHVVGKGSGFFEGFAGGNEIARETLSGIIDVITNTGVMNCDFADLRAVLQEAGRAVVSTALGTGEDAALEAAKAVLGSQSIEHEGLSRATKVLVNLTGSSEFGLHDANEALKAIHEEIGAEAELTVGVVRDDSLGQDVRVMMIASGFDSGGFGLQSAAVDVEEWSPPAPLEAPERPHSVVEVADGDSTGWGHSEGSNSAEVGTDHAYQASAEAATAGDGHAAGQPEVEAEDASRPPPDSMPPPNIRIEEVAGEEPTLRIPSFFRRRAIFR